MTNPSLITPTDKIILPAFEENARIAKMQEETIKNYNENIKNLDPDYTFIEPTNRFIVRMYVRPMKQDGLFLGNKMAESKTRQGNYHEGFVDDPFNFQNVAVIVASPKDAYFKPGDLVQIVDLLPKVFNQSVVGYDCAYLAPSALLSIIPKSLTDKHFGYAIVGSERIVAKLPNYEPITH